MADRLRVLSLFSGAGGFDLGLERAGMTVVGQVEIADHAVSTLRRRFPDVPVWRDISEVTGDEIRRTSGTIDVVCGGFPCQDVSIAGKRAGLAGERSGLWFQFLRIVDELRPPRRRRRECTGTPFLERRARFCRHPFGVGRPAVHAGMASS